MAGIISRSRSDQRRSIGPDGHTDGAVRRPVTLAGSAMSFELIILIAQAATVFFLTAWLTIGAFENLVHPEINAPFTAEVLDMSRMRQAYPDAYEVVKHRRIASPGLQLFLFRLIVFWEICAVTALWLGTGAFLFALIGWADIEAARAMGLLGALLFTATWAGFLVAGNWFCYWYCHEGAQNTHYQMMFWGLGTMIFLVAA